MAACRIYPFARENAKLFSQELLENVLEDFGHLWKSQRSKREKCLREVAMFAFTPEIGKLVSYFSRKHGGFVVMTSYNSWKYIRSHRVSVMEHMLSNAIASLCQRCDLEDDDLGLFVFMAIVTEYARFVIIDGQEQLVEAIVNTLSYCLTDIIPGGFLTTLDRMQYRASSFEFPETYTVSYCDSETSLTSPISTNSLYTPRSEFESPLNYTVDFPFGTQYNTPMEEIKVQCEQRELHRNLFKLKMKVDNSTQTDCENKNRLEGVESDSKDLEIGVKADGKQSGTSKQMDESYAYSICYKTEIESSDVAMKNSSVVNIHNREHILRDVDHISGAVLKTLNLEEKMENAHEEVKANTSIESSNPRCCDPTLVKAEVMQLEVLTHHVCVAGKSSDNNYAIECLPSKGTKDETFDNFFHSKDSIESKKIEPDDVKAIFYCSHSEKSNVRTRRLSQTAMLQVEDLKKETWDNNSAEELPVDNKQEITTDANQKDASEDSISPNKKAEMSEECLDSLLESRDENIS